MNIQGHLVGASVGMFGRRRFRAKLFFALFPINCRQSSAMPIDGKTSKEKIKTKILQQSVLTAVASFDGPQ